MTDAPNKAIASTVALHDYAMARWLSTAPRRNDGKTVPVIYATPDRAFGDMSRILERETGREVRDTGAIPLPMINFHRIRVAFNPRRFFGKSTFLFNRAVDAENLSGSMVRHPRPLDFQYQIDIWTRNRSTMSVYESWFEASFHGHELFVPIDYHEIWPHWGRKIVPIVGEGSTDMSPPDPGDDRRTIRTVYTVTMRGWALYEPHEVPMVTSVSADFYLAPTDANLLVDGNDVDDAPRTYRHVDTLVEPREES